MRDCTFKFILLPFSASKWNLFLWKHSIDQENWTGDTKQLHRLQSVHKCQTRFNRTRVFEVSKNPDIFFKDFIACNKYKRQIHTEFYLCVEKIIWNALRKNNKYCLTIMWLLEIGEFFLYAVHSSAFCTFFVRSCIF